MISHWQRSGLGVGVLDNKAAPQLDLRHWILLVPNESTFDILPKTEGPEAAPSASSELFNFGARNLEDLEDREQPAAYWASPSLPSDN